MFRPLAGGDDAGIQRGVVEIFGEGILSLFDDAGHAVAVLALHFLVEGAEHLLEARHVFARLLEVAFERLAQPFRRRGLRHLGQGLGQLFLRVVCVAQFHDERVVQGAALSHRLVSRCGVRGCRVSRRLP